ETNSGVGERSWKQAGDASAVGSASFRRQHAQQHRTHSFEDCPYREALLSVCVRCCWACCRRKDAEPTAEASPACFHDRSPTPELVSRRLSSDRYWHHSFRR